MLYDLVICNLESYSSRIRSFPDSGRIGASGYYEQKSVSFNPNDGVSTTCIVRDYTVGNYLAVYETGHVLEDKCLVSRWFILDAIRTTAIPTASGTQHRLILKRDVLTDFKSTYRLFSISGAYLLKGTLSDPTSPLCLNREDISLNQIKKEETLLKDETGNKYIVGYVPRDWPSEATTISVKLSDTSSYDLAVDDINAVLSKGKTIGIRNVTLKTTISGQMYNLQGAGTPVSAYAEIWSDMNGVSRIRPTLGTKSDTYSNAKYIVDDVSTVAQYQTDLANTAKGVVQDLDEYAIGTEFISDIEPSANVTTEATIRNAYNLYNNKMVLDKKTNKVFLVNMSLSGSKYVDPTRIASSSTPKAFSKASRDITVQFTKNSGGLTFQFAMDNTPGDNSFEIQLDGSEYQVNLTEVVNEVTCKIPAASTRIHLSDSPYDMFAIPVGRYTVVDGTKEFIPDNEELAMAVVTEMDTKLGSATSYDFQMLPYCPCREYIQSSINLGLKRIYYYLDVTNAQKSTLEDSSGNVYNFLIWCKSSSFSFNIPFERMRIETKSSAGISTYTLMTPFHATKVLDGLPSGEAFDFPSAESIEMGSDCLTIKLRNQCDMLRICSPNYSSVFEFSSQANGGVHYINVDCSYKPYNPYIHLNPDFGGLYGSDFNDQRGLVCGGDYSLARVTSSWADYQLSNKNYQSIFDREIQSLEVQQKYQRIGDVLGGITGALGAGTQGATTGALLGGGTGAVIGGLVSGALSGVGAIADYNINEVLRNEAISYRKDMFNYSLGNIKALPYGLSRTSAFNIQNKVWPFLEYYSCTDTEKKVLEQKLRYNGMSIGAFGAIGDYVPLDGNTHFVQASYPFLAIRRDKPDSHIESEISAEMAIGIYTRGEYL